MLSKLNIYIKTKLGCLNKKNLNEESNFFFTKDYFKDKNYIIGDFTYGKPNILFENPDTNLIVGKFCSIAEDVTIFLGGNHRIDWVTTYPFNSIPQYFPNASSNIGHPNSKGDVIIANDVWIGFGCIILSGVTISNGAVLAAGSVITKDVGAYEIWGGNPAKFIKKRFSEKTIEKLQNLKWWDWDMKKIEQNNFLQKKP